MSVMKPVQRKWGANAIAGSRSPYLIPCRPQSGFRQSAWCHVWIAFAWQGNRNPRTSTCTHHLFFFSVSERTNGSAFSETLEIRRTFGVPDPCDEVPFCQRPEVLVHTSVPEPRNLNDESGRHDLVVFGTHLDLAGPAINCCPRPHGATRKWFRTAVRTRNSSEVTYRRSVASNFIVVIEDKERKEAR